MSTSWTSRCFVVLLLASSASAQWKQTNGPYGGVINCLAVSGRNLFAGTDGAGLFRSTDDGSSWTAVNSGLTDFFIKSFAVSGATLFAGTSSSGVYRSVDNGTTWTAVNNGMPLGPINSMIVSGTHLHAAAEAGIFRSSDDGEHWVMVRGCWSERGFLHGFDCLAVLGTTLIASKWNVAFPITFRSTDDGATWTVLEFDARAYLSFAVLGTKIFTAFHDGVYCSTDSGATWMPSSLTETGTHLLMISGTDLFATTYDRIFRSGDSGLTWTSVGTSLPGASLISLAISGESILAGTRYGGVLRLKNTNESWTEINSGITNTDVQSLAVSGSSIFAGGYECGIFRSTDGGQSWVTANNGLSNDCLAVDFLAASGTTLFAKTSHNHHFYRSTDSGGRWTDVVALTGTDARSFAAFDQNLFVGTGDSGVFRSTDDGIHWIAVNSGLPVRWISALAVSGSTLFAGTFGKGVYRSNDKGAGWTACGLPDRSIASFAVSGSEIFAGTYNSDAPLFLSTDGGASWRTASNGLPAYSVAHLALSGTTLFASNYYGVFRTTDNGASWMSVNVGLTDTDISALAMSGGNLFAGTNSQCVWTRPLSEMVEPQNPLDTLFSPRVDIATGSYPWSTTAADFDGDGKMDLASPVYDENVVGLFRNIGSAGTLSAGSFAERVAFPTESGPTGIACGDLDSDGKVDLAIASAVSGTVSILRNTSVPGTMQFATLTSVPVGEDPKGLAVWDLDEDGKKDIVVPNERDSSVSILRNTSSVGCISFSAMPAIRVGPGPLKAMIADLDRDDRADIAVVNNGSSSISLLRNTSTVDTINFDPPLHFGTGSAPGRMAIADIDGDEAPDLIVDNINDGTLSLYQNISTPGWFSFGSPREVLAGRKPWCVGTGDFNGDDRIDIAVTNYQDSTVTIFVNRTVKDPYSFRLDLQNAGTLRTGMNPLHVGVNDLDGDGNPDLVVACRVSNTLSLFRNLSDVAALPAVPVLLSPGNGARNQPTSVRLKWSKSRWTTSYHVQVATDSLFSDALLDDSSLTEPTHLLSSLGKGQEYFWRVSARNGLGASPFSRTNTFTTVIAAPLLVAPPDRAIDQATALALLWNTVPEAARYRIQLGMDSLLSSITIDSVLADTSIVVHGLAGGDTYWWKVAAQYSDGWGEFSLPYRFSTLLTGIDETVEIPREFGLAQNYPNPFNPRTVVSSQLPVVSNVRIVICDVVGREVAVLVNERRAAGRYQDVFDASRLASGIYVCRMAAGAFVQSRKMLLIK